MYVTKRLRSTTSWYSLTPPPFSVFLSQNSVRHNLSLHNRFVKVQNDSSGKSSWWTVNLDAKSGRTSRRRSHSVDNTNTPSPKSRKKEKRSKGKKVTRVSPSSDILSSPCNSPTSVQPLLQPPWSPNPSCPSPTGSDLSPCYSPVLQSPVLQRSSRNVTPVSPLISPQSIDQQPANLFSGSNSSLLDDVHTPETGGESACVDMLAQLNLRASRDGMGSSSSLSSLNSPRLQALTKPHSPHPIFTFNGPMESGYSSSTCFSDTDVPDPSIPPPPAYEEHLVHTPPQPYRPVCCTPTRSGTHPLHISLAADMKRPRSGSEPVAVNLASRFPPDLDVNLFNTGFECDMDTIIQSEMEFNNGELDFQFEQPASAPSDPTLTSAVLGESLAMYGHPTSANSMW